MAAQEDVQVLTERVKGIDDKVTALMQSVSELNRAMAAVVRLEVHHDSVAKDIANLRNEDGKLDVRLDAIEKNLPGLLEVKSDINWLRRLVLGAVLMALLAVVIVETGA